MRLFEIDPDDNMVQLNKAWIMMVPEFAELIRRDKGSKGDYRGEKKLKAIKEFTFIYFMNDFASPLRDWKPEERRVEALRYANLKEEDIDKDIETASDYYLMLCFKASRSRRSFNAMNKMLDSLDAYMENVNFQDKDKKGELVHDPMKMAGLIEKADKVHTAVRNFEARVALEEKAADTGIRGAAELGDQEYKGRSFSEQSVLDGSNAARSADDKSTGSFSDMMHATQGLFPDGETPDEADEIE